MKTKNKKRTGLNGNISSSAPLSKLSKKELNELDRARELLISLKEKYELTFDDLKSLIDDLSFPASILNDKLTVLESIVKYLREEKKFSFSEIGKILSRDERNIWGIYNKSRKKYSESFVVDKSDVLIPISIFRSELSALESVVVYLHEKTGLKFSEIAGLLNRDQRTIWTVYSRARKKNVETK